MHTEATPTSELHYLDFDTLSSVHNYPGDVVNLPADLIAAIKAGGKVSSGWTCLEEFPDFSLAKVKEIGLREIDCPCCGWSKNGGQLLWAKMRYVSNLTGWHVTRPVLCICVAYAKFWGHWVTMVPKAYQWVSLHKLKFSERSRLDQVTQEGLIKKIQDNPNLSYLLAGPAGVGKTVFSYALLEEALYNWAWDSYEKGLGTEAVWCLSAEQLLKEHQMYDHQDWDKGDDVPQPTVTLIKIRQAVRDGLVPWIFITELDKVPKLTDARLAILAKLANEIYIAKGRLVADTNKRTEALKKWIGVDGGEAFVRRFMQDDGLGEIIDFYDTNLAPCGRNKLLKPELRWNPRMRAPLPSIRLVVSNRVVRQWMTFRFAWSSEAPFTSRLTTHRKSPIPEAGF